MSYRDRNNANYKRLRTALQLDGSDTVEICYLGGLDIGRDRAKRWSRSPSAGAGRYSVMTDEQFDAFCEGLVAWMAEQADEDE